MSIRIKELEKGKEQNEEQNFDKKNWEQQTQLRQTTTEKVEELKSLVSDYKKTADELRYTIEDQENKLKSMALNYEREKRILTSKHLEETRILKKRINNLENDLTSSFSLLERRKKEWENVVHETTRKYFMLLEQSEHINKTTAVRYESEIKCLNKNLREQRESFERRLMEPKGKCMERNSHQSYCQKADIVFAEVASLRKQLEQNKKEMHSNFAMEMLRKENKVKIFEYHEKISELLQEISSLNKTEIALEADVESLQNYQNSATSFAFKDEMRLFEEEHQKEIETIMKNFAQEFTMKEKQHDQEKQKIHERYTRQIKELQNSHLVLRTTFGDESERETCFEVEQRKRPTM